MGKVDKWFSTKVRLLCLVEGSGTGLAMEVIHVFRAREFDDAFERALALGRSHEQEYKNEAGKAVQWRLKEVVALDIIRSNIEGAEVHSEFVDARPDEKFAYGDTLHPEGSVPNQTI